MNLWSNYWTRLSEHLQAQRGMNRQSRARLLSGRSRNVSDPDDWLDLALVCAICGVAVVCVACACFGWVQP